MICNSIDRSIAVGEKRLDYKIIVNKVVDFLDHTIDGFPQYLINSNFSGKNEKDYNQKLATYLNICTSDFFYIETFRFTFIKDTYIKSSNYNPDIGVMLGNKIASTNDSFFHIECKLLPARAGHEREYVQGKLGGIQRFKEGNHGKGLDYSAMVGYIQAGSFEDWHQRINSWIEELVKTERYLAWTDADKLVLTHGKKPQKFLSVHQRLGHIIPIQLFHYWCHLS